MKTPHVGFKAFPSTRAIFRRFVCASALTAILLSGCAQLPDDSDNGNSNGNGNGNPPADPTVTHQTEPYPGFIGGDAKGEKNFANLINNYAEGKPARQPWAGAWWPYEEGGIASSVNGNPAGKYDAAHHGTTQAAQWELKNHGPKSPDAAGWVGHCNGWSAAAALYPEPRSEVTVNGVTFFVSDIKALLSEAMMEADSDFFGNRVDTYADYSTPKYTDVIPDQFFLVLTNYMGHLKQTVNIDRYTLDQVWNQPLEGYRMDYPKPSDYLGADPSAPNVYRMDVTATIWWAEDGVSPGVLTPPFDFDTADEAIGDDGIFTFSSRELKFEVWLDGPVVFGSDGKIASSGDLIVTHPDKYYYGGAWKMGEGEMTDVWPDYMWVPYSPQPSSGYMNPNIDIGWIETHLLVPGGHSDPGYGHGPTTPVPTPTITASPTPMPSPSHAPSPTPAPTPSPSFGPFPTATPTRGQ